MDNKDMYINFLKWLNKKGIQLTEEETQMMDYTFLGGHEVQVEVARGCAKTPSWIHYWFQYLLEKGDLKIGEMEVFE